MDYLTNYYRNLSEQLQQRVNFLQNLLEDGKQTNNRGISGLDSQHGGLPVEELQKANQEQEQKKSPFPEWPGKSSYTTFKQFHKSIYGDKSDELIKDALAARAAAKGTEHDLTGFADLGDYEKYGDSPVRINWGVPYTKYSGHANSFQRNAKFGTLDPKQENIINVTDTLDPMISLKATIRHEFEHAITSENSNPKSDPRSVLNSAKPPIIVDTPESKKHYSPKELGAFQSGYEADYFMDTGKTLKSNITDKDFDEFVNWGEKTGKIRDDHIELMRSKQYRQQMIDLAKQTAKVEKQKNSGQMMA